MIEEQLQLQIGLNIGTKKYEIKVPKKADLSSLVKQFLKDNRINLKYEPSIINLVKEKLAHQQRSQQNTIEDDGLNKNLATNEYASEVIRPQRVINEVAVNNKAKNILISKIQKQIQIINKENEPGRNVYEQWKQRQKLKNFKEMKQEKSYQSSKPSTQRQRHQADYFYKKGLQFQTECNKYSEDEFKKYYPFKINEHRLTQVQQQKLYNRLSRQKSNLNIKMYLQKCINENPTSQVSSRQDPVKQYVRKEDDKIDRLVFRMIKQRSLTPTKQSKSVSKSPFRKTIIK